MWTSPSSSRSSNRVALVSLLLTTALSPARAQPYRSAIYLTVLDVIASDTAGRAVSDLSRDDFEVTQDGRKQEITSFAYVSIPLQGNAQAQRDRRLFAVVLDDLNTRAVDTARARETLATIIALLPDGNEVAIVRTGQQAGTQQPTSDKTRLLANVASFAGRRREGMNRDDEVHGVLLGRAGQEDSLQNLRRAVDTLTSVTKALATAENRRKTVLYVTSGLPPNWADAFAENRATSLEYRELVTTAMQHNVAFYPIDVRGLAAPDDRDTSLKTMYALAADTGGTAIVNANDVGAGVRAAIEDASSYYILGVAAPDAETHRSGVHRINVRALRAGVKVRFRKVYVN